MLCIKAFESLALVKIGKTININVCAFSLLSFCNNCCNEKLGNYEEIKKPYKGTIIFEVKNIP